ncbi:MAG: DUF1194 domain-containing protein [Verrucomicrobia bacterium]|nr:DUF1194 domain-containing protein [Verrucomicrobiota bacterium]
MKTRARTSNGGKFWRSALLGSVLAGALLLPVSSASAETVDTELLLLVDISGSITDKQFDQMMGSYARAMTSAAMLDAIQSGATGSIATAVMFWSGSSEQSIGVDWMKISDYDSANRFAEAVAAAIRPFSGKTALATAMNRGVPMFGGETGGTDNGFQSISQILNVAGDGVDNDSGARTKDRSVYVDQARNNALAVGVDLINGLAINDNSAPDRTNAIQQYFTAHVIGGETGGVQAVANYAPDYASLEQTVLNTLRAGVAAGAAQSLTVVPEPAVSGLGVGALMLLALRRRK